MATDPTIIEKFEKLVSANIFALTVKQLESADSEHKSKLMDIIEKFVNSQNVVQMKRLICELSEPFRHTVTKFIKDMSSAHTKYNLLNLKNG